MHHRRRGLERLQRSAADQQSSLPCRQHSGLPAARRRLRSSAVGLELSINDRTPSSSGHDRLRSPAAAAATAGALAARPGTSQDLCGADGRARSPPTQQGGPPGVGGGASNVHSRLQQQAASHPGQPARVNLCLGKDYLDWALCLWESAGLPTSQSIRRPSSNAAAQERGQGFLRLPVASEACSNWLGGLA